MTQERKESKFNLRMPVGLRERLNASRQKTGRSMNAELIARIEQALTDDERRPELTSVLARLCEAIEGLSENMAEKR